MLWHSRRVTVLSETVRDSICSIIKSALWNENKNNNKSWKKSLQYFSFSPLWFSCYHFKFLGSWNIINKKLLSGICIWINEALVYPIVIVIVGQTSDLFQQNRYMGLFNYVRTCIPYLVSEQIRFLQLFVILIMSHKGFFFFCCWC